MCKIEIQGRKKRNDLKNVEKNSKNERRKETRKITEREPE